MIIVEKYKWTFYLNKILDNKIDFALIKIIQNNLLAVNAADRNIALRGVTPAMIYAEVNAHNKLISEFFESGIDEHCFDQWFEAKTQTNKTFLEKIFEDYIKFNFNEINKFETIDSSTFLYTYNLYKDLVRIPVGQVCRHLAKAVTITEEEISKLKVCLIFASKEDTDYVIDALLEKNMLNVYFNRFIVDYNLYTGNMKIKPSVSKTFSIQVFVQESDELFGDPFHEIGYIEITEKEIGELMDGNAIDFPSMIPSDFCSNNDYNEIAVRVINKIFGENIEVPTEHDISDDY